MSDDAIRLKDITIFGFYGVSPAEREVGQKIVIDLELYTDLSAACRSDSLQDTINYESVYSQLMSIVSGERRFRLLETLGEEICNTLIATFDVSRVTIRLRKISLPFPNSLSHVEVELTRDAPML